MRRIVIAKLLILTLWGLYLVIGLTHDVPTLAPTITTKHVPRISRKDDSRFFVFENILPQLFLCQNNSLPLAHTACDRGAELPRRTRCCVGLPRHFVQ